MTSDILKRAAEAVEGVTPGPWTVWEEKTATADDAKAELASQVDDTDGFCGAVFMLNAFGKCPALTGCGPTSKANAHFIAAARTLIPDMAAAIAERDEQIERLTARAEAAEAILADAGALRDAADRVSAWFATEARHLEGPRINGLRMAMVAYDRHMQPAPHAAAAARVLLADPDTFDGFKGYVLNRHDMDATMSDYAEGAMDYLRALAEQEKADE